MPFSYKKLTAKHADSWQILRLEGARDFPLGFLVTEEEATATSAERCREILDLGTFRGVFDETALVGFCGFRRERLERTCHRAHIGPLFVARAYQGSGAAHVMMQGVIEEARCNGIEQLELFVDTENHRAIAFYERLGFERIATHPDVTRIAGKRRNDHFYCLKLSN